MTIDDVCEFISTAKPRQLARIMRALIDRVSSYLGCATGLEDDLHLLNRQIDEWND